MWQFLCGFGTGVYVGTYYNCKPIIEYIRIKAKEIIPEDMPKPEKKDSENDTGRGKDD
jgi:hypothetical protein